MLVGQGHKDKVLVMQWAKFQEDVRGSAPFVLYWKNVQKERRRGRNLTSEGFDPGLWTWAASKNEQDPSTLLERGGSFLDEIHRLFLIQRRITEAKSVTKYGVTARAASSREIALGRFEDRFKEFSSNQNVKAIKTGDFVYTSTEIGVL